MNYLPENVRSRVVSASALLTLCFVWGGLPEVASAQVTTAQALQLKPVQHGDVDYSIPTASEQEDCTIETPTEEGLSGWIVKDKSGRTLRKFLDTNSDNNIDLWCYYKDGFEVYRDIDSDFDRKADNYRWFGSQGTRWGKDADQDGVIDSWKRISAEEVSEEVTTALRENNLPRFERLLLSEKELDRIGFGKERTASVKETLAKSRTAFRKIASENKSTFASAEWIHFGGLRPGIIPAGTDGASRDIVIYENVAALLRSGSRDLQISLGTLVEVDDCWRMIDVPELIDEKSNTSFASWYRPGEIDASNSIPAAAGNSEYQKLLASFESLDKKLLAAKSESEREEVYDSLAETISSLALNAENEEEAFNWSRQFADSLTAAFQSGEYPAGLEKLAEFIKLLEKNRQPKEAIALVQYRLINAEFGASLNDSQADVAEAQAEWLDSLEQFTKDFPKDENTADAMMQLAMADEFEGEKKAAESWYQRVATEFTSSAFADKARGAIRRLNSIGDSFQLTGKTVNGRSFNLRSLKGKIVLIHYWADWCEICKEEFSELEKLAARYDELELVGVNCDNELPTAQRAVRSTGVRWTQLYSEGGFNAGLAADMGIVSLPSMILVDQAGQIVSTTLTATTLEREVKSLLK